LREVLDVIGKQLDGDLGIAALAARAGVSQRHLTRLFVKHLGQTPGRYVRTVRTEAAAQLLLTTTLPLSRVAVRCGFASAEALRQAFAQRYGVSPSHYRATQTSTDQPVNAITMTPTPNGTSSNMQNSASDRETTLSLQ
jgi:transcriptional regulator GlxA family with amidase domain